MDLIDRLLDHDLAFLRQLLTAGDLTDAILDAPLPMAVQTYSGEPEQRTIRDLIDMTIFTKEVWIAAVEHQEFPSREERSLNALAQRSEAVLPIFAALVRRVRDAGEWNTEFVDDLCEKPERFTFGGMIAHVLTTNAYRRGVLIAALRSHGMEFEQSDPLDWELALAKA